MSPVNSRTTGHEALRRARWRMLLITMTCYLSYYTGRQNFGFAAKSMQEELHLSGAALGSISAALLLAYGIGQALNGNLGDRYGARLLVSAGAAGSVILNWVTSFGTSWAGILVPWTINGYLQSFGWAPSCRLLADWFPRQQRGKAYGMLLLSAGLSSVVTFAICFQVLRWLDWRNVFRVPVLLLALGGLQFAIFARNSPRDLGLANNPGGGDVDADFEVTGESAGERCRAVLRNRSFLLATTSIGFESIARYGLLYWVPVRFLGPGWRQDADTMWVTLMLPVGMAAGALSAGYLSDGPFGGRRTYPIALLLFAAALTTLALAFLPASWTTANGVLLAAAGFLVYGPQAAYWALCTELVGRSRAGTGVGLMDAAAYAFAAVGEILIGVTMDRTGTTAAVFYVVTVASLAGAGLILGIQEGPPRTDDL